MFHIGILTPKRVLNKATKKRFNERLDKLKRTLAKYKSPYGPEDAYNPGTVRLKVY